VPDLARPNKGWIRALRTADRGDISPLLSFARG